MSYEDRKSMGISGVWKTSTHEEVRKHWDRVTGALEKISAQRRRVDVSYNPSMLTALRQDTCTGMDEERFKKTCIKEQREKEAFVKLSTAHAERTQC